jgi:tripartite-type tricarboxylate transporter receptor subunit TctC
MPSEITNKLTSEIKKIMATQDFQTRMEKQGTYAQYLSPAQLSATVQHDLQHWEKIVKTANISLD